MKSVAIALGLAACATLRSNLAAADEDLPAPAPGWRYVIEPYAFLPVGITGDVSVRTREIPVSADLSDLLKKFEFGGEAHFEAWKDRFGIIVDGTFAHVGQSNTLANRVPVDWGAHLILANALIGVRPIVAPLGSEGAVSVEFDAGGRFAWLNVDATIGGDSFNADRAFARGVFGGRVPVRLSREWVIGARAYVTVPDPGWSALGWVELDPCPSVAITAAYKVEHFDWPSDQVSLRATAHGPYIGVGFPFGAGNVY